MDNHIFKPGDMALITNGRRSVPKQVNCIGLTCIVESHPYTHPGFPITTVNITVGAPGIKRADVQCLKYIPPDEWPKSEFKARELILMEKNNGTKRERPSKRQELETTE